MMHSRRGFTLLEAVIALAIVSVSVIGVFSAFGAHLTGAERARNHLTALTLAQEQLSRLRLASATELALLPDSVASGEFAAPFNAYRWTATSSAVFGEMDLYDLRVIVEGNRARSELTSRRYRPAPLGIVE